MYTNICIHTNICISYLIISNHIYKISLFNYIFAMSMIGSIISKSERVYIGKIQISRILKKCQYNWKCGRYSPLKRIAAESVISGGEFRYALRSVAILSCWRQWNISCYYIIVIHIILFYLHKLLCVKNIFYQLNASLGNIIFLNFINFIFVIRLLQLLYNIWSFFERIEMIITE